MIDRKRALRRGLKMIHSAVFPAREQHIPKTALGHEHVRNATLLPDRTELLKLLPKKGVVAELGVDEGNFSQAILQHNQPRELHLVDVWDSDRYNTGKRRHVEQRFANEIANGSVVIDIGLSTEVAGKFPDAHFDWIYIDTDHSYRTTKAELELYAPKVKPQGIIAGHDYIVGNWDGAVRYGVIEAVHEFCVKHHWEILHLTMELNTFPSFAIRRIR